MATQLDDARIRVILDTSDQDRGGAPSKPGGGGGGGGGGKTDGPPIPGVPTEQEKEERRPRRPRAPRPRGEREDGGGGGGRRVGGSNWWTGAAAVFGTRGIRGSRGLGRVARGLGASTTAVGVGITIEETVRALLPTITAVAEGVSKEILADAFAKLNIPRSVVDDMNLGGADLGQKFTRFLDEDAQISPLFPGIRGVQGVKAVFQSIGRTYSIAKAMALVGSPTTDLDIIQTLEEEYDIAFQQNRAEATLSRVRGRKIGDVIGRHLGRVTSSYLSR